MNFILASSSPRRKELLKMIGINPVIVVPDIDENTLPGEKVEDFLKRVTIAKGEAIYNSSYFHDPVISSDTIVLCENRVIGKPSSRDEAYEFMKLLSNNKHEVLTGVAIRYEGQVYYDYARTGVTFSEISEEELLYYLEHEEYMDKAGAYAIQGKASVYIQEINGCFFNVMGFPLNLFYGMLKKIGIVLYK